jgi:hypothetical protein
MKLGKLLVLLALGTSVSGVSHANLLVNGSAEVRILWSGDVHSKFLRQSFFRERNDCLDQMARGSEWVDSLPNQAPSKAYMHAMRSGNAQSVDDARNLMAGFIQDYMNEANAEQQRSLEVIHATPADPLARVTHDGKLIRDYPGYLKSCYLRGAGLHPVMDSTSPSHANFAIWSITDIAGIFEHGNLPGSLEDMEAIIQDPDHAVRTIGLMKLVNKIYMDLGVRDFRFDIQ